jgi:serine/threonine-protein kinase
VGIPAFQPGIAKADVVRMLGFPTGTARGYWPNTRAVFYELIPDEVSLGFLFDRTTERIRQTEASFTSTVESRLVSLTLNGMLGCRLNDQIQQGLQRVWQRETQQFSFTLGSLKGIIQRQKGDRLYIGIWEADLH